MGLEAVGVGAVLMMQQHNKFVTADTGNGQFITDQFAQPFAKFTQRMVPGDMAETVVKFLEMVEIDTHHGGRNAGFV